MVKTIQHAYKADNSEALASRQNGCRAGGMRRWRNIALTQQPETASRVSDYCQAFFCAFRHLAQRAFWAAMIRLRAAGDIVRPLRAAIETTFCPFTFAHRAR